MGTLQSEKVVIPYREYAVETSLAKDSKLRETEKVILRVPLITINWSYSHGSDVGMQLKKSLTLTSNEGINKTY